IPDTGGTYFLPRLAGTARAMGMALLGEKITAEQAAAWGLIWQCVEDAELAPTADRLPAHFAQAPTRGLARTKQALYASPGNSLEAQLDLERDYMSELGASDDYREGVAAFVAKGPPRFGGREPTRRRDARRAPRRRHRGRDRRWGDGRGDCAGRRR